MDIITDFNINVDKDKVLKIMNYSRNNQYNDEIEKTYDVMLKKAKELVEPKAIFQIDKMPLQYGNYDRLKQCSHLISCLVTIGKNIDFEISKNLENGNYLKGFILDVIADQILFDVSHQMYKQLAEYGKRIGLGLTPRMSPGENEIPIEITKDILLNLSGNEKLGINITEGYMLNPLKTLAYFYGADKNLPILGLDHDCCKCTKINCQYGNKDFVNIKVFINNEKQSIKVSTKKSLLEGLVENKIYVESPCQGNGTCGKCKIQIIEGNVEPVQGELVHLTTDELENNIRLACYTYPKENLSIKINNINDKDFDILSNYQNSNQIFKPIIELTKLKITQEELNQQKSLTDKIKEKTSQHYHFSLKSLRKAATFVSENAIYDKDFTLYGEDSLGLITYGSEVLDICRMDEILIFGIAVDIGTTTIAIALVDLQRGKTIGTYTLLNSQRQYGADIISRIQFSMSDHLKVLTKSIRKDILRGIKELCRIYQIDLKSIYHVVLSGNTAMVYLLLDIPAHSLVVSPFTTTTTSLLEYGFKEVFDYDCIECKVTLLPGISAYIGADIVSGMFNCGFNRLTEVVMLIDIGTNGEIVIGDHDKIYCTATAAGPAFEGANIKDGIGSIKGAICSVDIENGNIIYRTIGGEEPIGICGSGLIDIVSAGLRNGMIDGTGKLSEKCKEGCIEIYRKDTKRIGLYQKDIREFQLAKSAIRSGIEVLIHKFGCSYHDIEAVYIAGGFGNNLNIHSAVEVGMIPKELCEKIKLAGNSSLGGAVDFLLSKKAQEMINEIVGKAKYFELSTEEEFNILFVDNMFFHHDV